MPECTLSPTTRCGKNCPKTRPVLSPPVGRVWASLASSVSPHEVANVGEDAAHLVDIRGLRAKPSQRPGYADESVDKPDIGWGRFVTRADTH